MRESVLEYALISAVVSDTSEPLVGYPFVGGAYSSVFLIALKLRPGSLLRTVNSLL